MKIGRNDPCPCGSGIKYKKCCAAKGEKADLGLKHAIRMKGGVVLDPVAGSFHAIVHSWDNAECRGEPEEWRSDESFETEEKAMEYYKMKIRPVLERMMKEAAETMRVSTFLHKRLEE